MYLSTQDLADEMGSSTRFWVDEITAGRIPAIRLGKKTYRVARSDLDAYIEAQKVIPRTDTVGEALATMSA